MPVDHPHETKLPTLLSWDDQVFDDDDESHTLGTQLWFCAYLRHL
jgi:hypothetical protein